MCLPIKLRPISSCMYVYIDISILRNAWLRCV